MNNDDRDILDRLKDRLRDPRRFVDAPPAAGHKTWSPVTPAELALAEKRLSFQLPPLLRSIYLEVGNGGFGPGYGLLALNEDGPKNYHQDLVDWYLECVNHPPHPEFPPWPRKYLTLCDWGDGIASELDWETPPYPVYRFRGDQYEHGPYETVLKLEAPSLHAWLGDWLDGVPLFERGQQ